MDSPAKASELDELPDLQSAGEGAVQSFLEVLERHRMDCEQQGKYDDAELAKTRLEQLRSQEESRRREELRSQQLAERLGVEEAHMKELQEFNEIWDKKVAEFEAHATNLETTLQDRHQQERAAFLEKARRDTAPRTARFSRELLNLRKIQDSLAKQKNYSEAAKTKAHADTIERKETAEWKAKRDEKIDALDKQFMHKQSLEMGGLKKRIQSGREEQKHARKTELKQILQRYHNVKTQLESQQNIINQRAEKFPVGATSQFSTMSMSRPLSSRATSHMSLSRPSSALPQPSAAGYPAS